MAKKTNADKLRTMVDGERLGLTLVSEILDEWDIVREWADALTTVVENIDTVRDAIEAYEEAEGRDDKADAREEALSAIDELLSASGDLASLDDLPNMDETPYVEAK